MPNIINSPEMVARYKKVRGWLVEKIKESQLSQSEISKRLQISQATLSKYIAGGTIYPSLTIILESAASSPSATARLFRPANKKNKNKYIRSLEKLGGIASISMISVDVGVLYHKTASSLATLCVQGKIKRYARGVYITKAWQETEGFPEGLEYLQFRVDNPDITGRSWKTADDEGTDPNGSPSGDPDIDFI